MTAIGPYAGTEFIDFEQLGASGLFLLEGPTGAGKSTILDAVAFALYGSPAADSSGAARLHCQFAAAGVTPTVVLVASFGGKRYRIERVPRHFRPKLKGEGTKEDSGRVLLQRWKDDDWTVLSEDKNDTTAQIRRIVGLDRDQFTTVILLPQGEFATFLRADDAERRTLLTKLFGTGIYDRITAHLEQARREAFRAVEAAEDERNRILDEAIGAASLTEASAEEAREAATQGVESLTDCLASIAAMLETSAQELTNKARDAREAEASAREASVAASGRKTLLGELAKARSSLEAHEKTRPVRDEKQSTLESAERAARVQPLLEPWKSAGQALAAARGELEETMLAPTTDELEGRGASDLEAEAGRKQEEAARLEGAETDEGELAGILLSRTRRSETLDDLKAEQSDLLKALDPNAEDSLAQRHALAQSEHAASVEAERQLIDLRPRETQARTAATAARQRDIVAARLVVEEAAERTGGEDQHKADQALLDLMQRRVDGMAFELALRLTDGKPCEVCGSTSHPAPATSHDAPVGDADLEQARLVAEQARAHAEQARNTAAESRREVAEQRAICGDQAIADLEQAHADVKKALTSTTALAALAEERKTKAADLQSELDKAQSRSFELVGLIATGTESMRQLDEDLKVREAALAKARGDFASVAQRRLHMLTEANSLKQRAALITKIAQALAAENDAGALAATQAAVEEFDALDSVEAALRSPEALLALRADVQSWDKEEVRRRTALHDDRFGSVAETDADSVEQDAVATKGLLDQRERERTLADKAATAAEGHQQKWRDAMSPLTSAQERWSAATSEFEPIAELAGYANGSKGTRRATLVSYVLRTRFEDVVHAANHRLATMSQHRYALMRTEDSSKKSDKVGLGLAVIDGHTGEHRPTDTLSGGEQFYTSLSLALGLADVVKAEAGGIELDTLFIDEGFGSLDGETLEQVMAVIDELRGSGRTVGIVSHVEGLKERVPERVEVRRLTDGSSTLTVRA